MAEGGQIIRVICYYARQDGQNFSYCTGFFTANRSEVTVHVPQDKGIYEGTIFTFKVKSRRQDGVCLPDNDSIRVEDDNMGLVSLGHTSNGSVVTKMSTNIVFSSLMEDRDHCAWSREFGKILIPESFHIVPDAVYKVDVVRDRSRLANEVQALFSICEGEIPKKLEINAKSQQCLQDIQEELRTREEKMKQQEAERRLLAEPIGQMGFAPQSTSTPNQQWQNGRDGRNNSNYSKQPFSRQNAPTRGNPYYPSRGDDGDDELMKCIANGENTFLIARIFPEGRAGPRGEAWCPSCRSITLNYLRLDGMETRVSVGDWCTGVIKYNRKLKRTNSGFVVEKISSIEDTKPLCTRVDRRGVVQLELEMYFDHDKTEIIDPTPDRGFYAVKHEQVQFVIVPPPVFQQHYGKKVHVILNYRHVEDETLSNWVFAEFVRYLEDHERVAPEFVDEPEESENFSELMGGPPDLFDEDEGGEEPVVFSYSATNRTQFTDQPTGSNLTRPTPVRLQTTGVFENDAGRMAQPNSPTGRTSRFSAPNRSVNQPRSDNSASTPSDRGYVGNQSQYGAGGSGMGTKQPNMGVKCVGVVTAYSPQHDCAILYCTREEEGEEGDACLMRNVSTTKVRNGDWVKLQARKLPTKTDSTFGCIWEAITGTVESTEALNPTKVTRQNCVQLDTVLDFSYMRYHPLAVYSEDVGYTLSSDMVEREDTSRPCSIRAYAEEVEQLKQMGRAVPKCRAWIQYIYNDDRKEYDWHLVTIRGTDKDVTAYDTRVKQENMRGIEAEDEDEIAMQKQKAKARMEMENNVPSSSSMNGRSTVTSRSAGARNSQMKSREEPDRSGTASVCDSMSMLSTNTIVDEDLLELWNIDKVRSAVKEKNYDLYVKLDTQAEEIHARTSRSGTALRDSPASDSRFAQPSSSSSGHWDRSASRMSASNSRSGGGTVYGGESTRSTEGNMPSTSRNGPPRLDNRNGFAAFGGESRGPTFGGSNWRGQAPRGGGFGRKEDPQPFKDYGFR